MPPRLPRHRDHHAEVEQDDPAVGRHEQVPRMWVGVEQTVDEHHLDVELHHGRHDVGATRGPVAITGDIARHYRAVYPHAAHVLHHEHALANELALDPRNQHVSVPPEILADAL